MRIEPLIEIIRRSLQGERYMPPAQAYFAITRLHPHGHAQAVALAMVASCFVPPSP